MTRTRVAAPRYSNAEEGHAESVAQQPDINLNPGADKGQANVELAPPVGPKDLDVVRFMEEPVRIMLHDNVEDTGPLVLNVNGEDAIIPRGQDCVVKRKFVQQLLDMRETKFTQPKRDQFNVERGNKLLPKTVLMQPFTLVEDRNPNGPAWFRTEQQRQASIASGLR